MGYIAQVGEVTSDTFARLHLSELFLHLSAWRGLERIDWQPLQTTTYANSSDLPAGDTNLDNWEFSRMNLFLYLVSKNGLSRFVGWAASREGSQVAFEAGYELVYRVL